MDSDAIIALTFILAFFVFIFSMIRMKHRHELEKLDRIAQGNADRSLTTSELETMVRDIVAEATEPLQARVEQLTQAVNQPSAQRLLDPGGGVDDKGGAVADKTVGRRERS
jgi:hypothetical protein